MYTWICVCVCVCVCVYIYIYIYIPTHTHSTDITLTHTNFKCMYMCKKHIQMRMANTHGAKEIIFMTTERKSSLQDKTKEDVFRMNDKRQSIFCLFSTLWTEIIFDSKTGSCPRYTSSPFLYSPRALRTVYKRNWLVMTNKSVRVFSSLYQLVNM